MKKFLYTVLGYILLPFIFIFFFIYGICHIINILCVKFKEWFKKFMNWIDKNITDELM